MNHDERERLHQQIMNIPVVVDNDLHDAELQAYRRGHRDARHAAAELVAAPQHQWEFYANGSFCRRCGAQIGSGTPCR
jgi:hypothetical protein